MNQRVDLHMHTLYSDGIKTPEELIEFARSRGVSVMCINDHDNVKGVMNMLELEKKEDITVLCGIELSSSFTDGSTIHTTGYFPRDTDFASMQAELEKSVPEKRYVIYTLVNHK